MLELIPSLCNVATRLIAVNRVYCSWLRLPLELVSIQYIEPMTRLPRRAGGEQSEGDQFKVSKRISPDGN